MYCSKWIDRMNFISHNIPSFHINVSPGSYSDSIFMLISHLYRSFKCTLSPFTQETCTIVNINIFEATTLYESAVNIISTFKTRAQNDWLMRFKNAWGGSNESKTTWFAPGSRIPGHLNSLNSFIFSTVCFCFFTLLNLYFLCVCVIFKSLR